MVKKLWLIGLCLVASMYVTAQEFEKPGAENRVYTNSFWSDCFVQADLDMSLQNPYGYSFSDVFPNGKSFGLDIAIGKWFAPEIGLRGKINWENALPLLKNGHANWLAPFYHPGVNRDRGGYIAFYGDVLLNMHNFFGPYRADRTWNLSAYPRIGINYNFGVSKGALVAGMGVLNTYRLDSHWSLFFDAAYMMTGSGFVGSENVEGTGTGSSSNGYVSLGLGAQYSIGSSRTNSHSVQTNGFWDNWFVQAGLDMSLMNPYGCDFFSNVFPKGQTFGLNAALGKWFTPELALRGRVNWENGLIKNSSLEWVPPADEPGKNYDGHGFAVFSLDAMLNLTNIFAGYRADKLWHTSGYARAGIISHFEIGSASPLLGAGLEQTYRLNDRWSLFGAVGYQVTTSESSAGMTGMAVGEGSNGFFNIDFGVVFNIGERIWKRKDTTIH